MNYALHRKDQGYSLLETIVSLSVFLLVLFAVYVVLESNQSIYAKGEGKVDVQQSARAAMDEIARLLRNAGYFPENFDANPGNDLINPIPIQVATDNALAIYGDADGTGTSNVFLFCWNEEPDPLRPPRNVQYVRWKRSAFGDPGAYNCNQGMILARALEVDLIFAYFDNAGNQLPTPVVGGSLDSIRRVVITVTATEDVPGQRQQQIYTLTSNVRLRNLN